ncbi:MAG: hypothetical protein ABI614_13705 [Planctomycetota bacterium]
MRSISFASPFAVSLVVCPRFVQAADEGLAAEFEKTREAIRAAAARIDQLIAADRKVHGVEPSLPAND